MNVNQTLSIEEASHNSPVTSLLLHLVPGVLATAGFLVLRPVVESAGFPPLLAFLLAILLLDLPFMLGVMLNEGKKSNGRFGLKGVVHYGHKLAWKTFALIFVGAFVGVYLLVMLVTPISAFLEERFFTGLPAWLFLEERTQYEVYAKNVLVAIFALQLVLTGVALPWVEELYFRGYLLPRLSRYGPWRRSWVGRSLVSITSGSYTVS